MYGAGEVGYDYDDGKRFAEYEKVRQRMPFVRRGSEGYEVRPIDHEQLLAECNVVGMCLSRQATLRAWARVVGKGEEVGVEVGVEVGES